MINNSIGSFCPIVQNFELNILTLETFMINVIRSKSNLSGHIKVSI